MIAGFVGGIEKSFSIQYRVFRGAGILLLMTTAEGQSHEATSQSLLDRLAIRRNPPALMSVSEAAIYIGISERKLRDEIARRKIKAIRIGARIILRAKDIDAALDRLSA